MTDPVFFTDRTAWREWLKRHHNSESEVWILAYKRHTGKPCLSYIEALEEALCYGWIDSRLRRIDDEKHLWRFAPRRPDSIWSLNNRRHAERLIKAGRMTKHGLAKIEAAKKTGEWDKALAPSTPPEIPEDLRAALKKNGVAWRNFEKLAKSYQTQFLYWIMTAKRPETRQKRIMETVRKARQNKKLYPI